MSGLRLGAIVVALAAPSWSLSQAPSPAQASALQGSGTIGEALAKAGLADAGAVPGAPDTNRVVSSSEFAASDDSFVAAVYFADEIKDGLLGALRVWRFDRHGRRWIQASSLPEMGSVMGVRLEGGFVLVDTHDTPSAGSGLVFDATSLRLVVELPGFWLRAMPGGRVRFSHNMVHFAPTHQARLMVFDARSGRTVEVFPGTAESPLAVAFRDRVRTAFAALPAAVRREYLLSVHGVALDGGADDFDRGFLQIEHRDDGQRLALLVSYDSRLPGVAGDQRMDTVVSCAVVGGGAWACEERELPSFAAAAGVALTRDEYGRLTEASRAGLMGRALETRSP